MNGPRLLVIDIETSPALVYTWGLFDTHIGISQVVKPTEMICWAAKWKGERKIIFRSVFHDGKDDMLKTLWDLLDEADVVVGYNSTSFDVKHINREFLEAGMLPPAPFSQIDLYRTVKSKFRFLSGKLDWVAQRLDIGSKTHHEGFGLWEKCLKGEEAAWNRMRKYNIQDVRLTEELYFGVLPWIPNHPNVTLYTGVKHSCPTCGSVALQKRGFARTRVSTFQRWLCNSCGTYSRSGARLDGADLQ